MFPNIRSRGLGLRQRWARTTAPSSVFQRSANGSHIAPGTHEMPSAKASSWLQFGLLPLELDASPGRNGANMIVITFTGPCGLPASTVPRKGNRASIPQIDDTAGELASAISNFFRCESCSFSCFRSCEKKQTTVCTPTFGSSLSIGLLYLGAPLRLALLVEPLLSDAKRKHEHCCDSL